MQPDFHALRHDQALLTLPADAYRTARLTGLFAVPLLESTAAEYAILPGLLTHSCRRFPSMTLLNRQLNRLYGATVSGQVEQLGGWQVLRFSISFLQQRYTLSREDLTADCTRLLLELLLDPAMENGQLRTADLRREQRCLLEQLQSEINNKRLYARKRCIQLLCPNHPFSVDPDGTPATVEALTPEKVTEARLRLLNTARIHWIYQGDGDTAALAQQLEEAFSALPGRKAVSMQDDPSFTLKEAALTEKMTLKQAKLVLGFRLAAAEPDGPIAAARLMNTLLGGCPSSLLFQHVREEQSLCYYCSSSYDRFRGLLLVDSGVEAADAARTKAEILHQLSALQQGQFSAEELEDARRSAIQALCAVEETPLERERYYMSQTVYDRYETPEKAVSALQAVTAEDICRVARTLHLDTTYLLCPQNEEVTV